VIEGPLHSDDPVTRVMHGKPVDFVPVAQVYESLGPLQYLRTERSWQLWRKRLQATNTDVLPLDYETYLDHQLEIETGILTDIYTRPAWVGLRRNMTCEEVAGSAIIRRENNLFWLAANGDASWIAPTLQGAEARSGSRWADLWDRGDTAEALARAAAEPERALHLIPQPTSEQVSAVLGSTIYDLARALAAHFKDNLPQYITGSTPYNDLPYLLGFQAFMSAMAEMPERVHQVLQKHRPQPSARLSAERQLGISLIHIEECLASADLISPRMYLEFAFPYDKLAVQFYEDMGFRTMLYFSGNLMPFLKYLKKLPFTALSFEEDRKNYGINLGEVRRALGPDRVIFGNLDAMFVEKASDDEVLSEVKRQLSVAGRSNFILSAGSPLTPGTSLDRIRLLTESTRRIG